MNKKYWLKGGLILSVLSILLFSLGVKVIFILGWLFLLLIDGLFLGGTIKYPTFSGDTSDFLSFLLSIIIYFVLGAFFGWIYGKLKTKKEI